jgi:hypothetical protein
MAANRRQTFEPGDRAYVHDYGARWTTAFVVKVEPEMRSFRRWGPDGAKYELVPTGKETIHYATVATRYVGDYDSAVFGPMYFKVRTTQNNRARIRNVTEYEPLRLEAAARAEERERARQATQLRRERNARAVAERIADQLRVTEGRVAEIAEILLDEAGDGDGRRQYWYTRIGPRITVTDNETQEEAS